MPVLTRCDGGCKESAKYGLRYNPRQSPWHDANAQETALTTSDLSSEAIDRIIQMAWEDRTAFDAINAQFGVSEAEVIKLMRKHLKRSSFELWRARVTGRKTKHQSLRSDAVTRFKSSDQKGS